ncbi:MAG: recombinase family protein [Chloroflexi bacterium]|nr:MAG: recombinase family protein [Chloroflexota bacterium]
MRAVGYFRETKSRGLAEQSESFLEFCKSNGFEAAATFLDPGSPPEAPGFKQMLEFVRLQGAHGFLLVAISDLMNLGSGPTEAVRRYFQLASLGVPIISLNDEADLPSDLLRIWSRSRSNGSVGERVKAAMRQKAVRGEVLGRPPYGYRVGLRRRLVIVPVEGSVIRYIFRLYLKDGLGIRRIARRLNDEQLRTRKGGLWSMVTVRDILRNRAYVGTYSRFGVRVPASHRPLIAQEDFQRVQERLDQRRPVGEARRMSPFLLSGITYCGYCGNKMIGVTRKQRWQRRSDGMTRMAQYRYYQCESRTNRSLCDYHTRRAVELEEEVRRSLKPGGSRTTKTAGNGALAAGEAEAQIRRLREKAKRLDRRLEQYLESAVSGRINQDKLRSLGVNLASEQLQVEEQLVESHKLAELRASEAERRRQRDNALHRLHENWNALAFGERRELIRAVLDRIVVKDDAVEMVFKP